MILKYVLAAALTFVAAPALAGDYYAGTYHGSVSHRHVHVQQSCCCCTTRYSHKRFHKRKKIRVETSVARAGLGGDSIVRANNDSRSTDRIFYVYKPLPPAF